MKITKTTTKIYHVEPIGKVLNETLFEILEFRDKHGHKTGFFKKCFICDNSLSLDKTPNMVSVSGLGNRFCCEECYEKLIKISDGGE